MKCNL